ncbi:hypothetical protein EHS25_009049 [Saitozyma podzolica]|uniref:Xylanolytic transcriptional activator regulatory domain-containing protein n=1 Tax=Saitozyma podzolica TaxID=1890683 RepID=A0A427YKS4_9TREE|nr:hypothetical protein EHS25_009049 [Saitozyma podzolica]
MSPTDLSSVFTQRPTAAAGHEAAKEDPVSLEFLSMLEAENLRRFFFRHLNPMIALLDPDLHDSSYMRQNSPLLYTAVLAVAAKFVHRELHQPLLTHAQMILNRATNMGECSLGLVQSLLIMVYWKTPTDTSAWVKIGIGIRLAYQLGLHVPRTKKLPSDDRDARILRSAERTWFCLHCFDRAYSEIFSLPTTIRLEELGDVEAWANEQGAPKVEADMHVASAVSTASAQMMWAKFRQSRDSLPRQWQWDFLSDLAAQYERHMKTWFPDDPSTRRFSAAEERSLKWFDLNHLLKIKHEMLDCAPPPNIPVLMNECLVLAQSFAGQTEAISEDGSLLYLQDTSATHLSSFGLVIYKLFWRLDARQQRLAIQTVRRVHQSCTKVAGTDDQAVTAFVARFLQRLLRMITQDSRANTQPGTPTGDGGAAPGALPQNNDLFTDLEEFLRLTATVDEERSLLDDQFWSSILPESAFGAQ